MAEDNTKIDFLRFSAYSFKDMITRKMSENTKFTDQVYEGSNLAILIDLCSYLFQGLTYCLNNAASESMFSDTRLYENINRLVRLIGYHPKGFIPSSCNFMFTTEKDDIYIPLYTAVDTGLTDSTGKKVYYSFDESYKIVNGENTVQLYNGRWKLYSTVFTASGVKYETFTLSNIKSDSDEQQYTAYGHMHVYVKRNNTFIRFIGLTDEIFYNASTTDLEQNNVNVFKNTSDDRYFSISLNEDKEYVIKFGNDNNGQKLEKDDRIYVFYLDSNGQDAVLQVGDVKGAGFEEPASLLGLTDDMFYRNLLDLDESTAIQEDTDIDEIKELLSEINDVTNITVSTTAQLEQDVEDIRENAPDFYKLGNRLITKSDFEYYIKNRFSDNIIDVKCHNNWDFISQFYGWLYQIGMHGQRTAYSTSVTEKRASNPKYYISQAKLYKYDYYYADPADQNNVYLWTKMQIDTAIQQEQLDLTLTNIKLLTSEIVYVSPIDVYFMICAAPVDRVLEYFDTQEQLDENNESYLEITINDNTLYSNSAIQIQINQLFNTYFKTINQRLGNTISPAELENQIYNINGVERIRTVFSSEETTSSGEKRFNDKYINGISFASWSSTLLDTGDDLNVTTTNIKLEEFQFPALYSSNIVPKIKVIKRSFSNNSTIQY